MLFSPVYTCSEPRRVESYPRQFVSPSSRDLCVLSVSALDRSFSCILSRLQLSTFDLQPSLSSKSLPHNPFADPHPLNLYAATLYKNSWGAGVLGSGVGTRHSSPATALKFFLFTLLRTLWHDAKLNSFLFKRLRTLYPKTPGLGGSKGRFARRKLKSIVVGGAHGTACSAKEPGSPFGPRNSLELRQVRIRHRHDQQGQQQTECLPANDGYRDRRALLRPCANADSHRDQSSNDGKSGHQDGPQPHAIRFQDRFAHGHAFGTQSIGVIHLQDAVLFHNAEQQKHSQGAPQAQRAPRDPQREERKGDAQRKRQHDDKRISEALKLRRQHHIHKDGGQQHGQHEIPGGLFQNFHLPRKDVRIPGGQSNFLDGLHRVSGGQVEWIACSHVAENTDLKFAVVALEARRPGAATDAGDDFQTHLSQFC